MSLIDIVIPTTELNHSLLQLVESLVDVQKKYSSQIWVCLNPSQEYLNNPIYKKIASQVQLINLSDRGVNRARQAGLDRSAAKYILFLDADCLFNNAQSIHSWLQMFQSEPDLFAVGGYYQADRLEMSFFQKQYFLMQNNWVYSGQLKSGFSLFLLGGFFMLNRELALKQQIQFDPEIVFGGSEKEFFIQAYLKKLKVRLTSDAIVHRYDQSGWQYIQKTYKQGRGQAYIDQKHGDIHFFENLLHPDSADVATGILKWAFWWGYSSYLGNYSLFFKTVFRNNWGKINAVRYQVVSRIKKDLEKRP